MCKDLLTTHDLGSTTSVYDVDLISPVWLIWSEAQCGGRVLSKTMESSSLKALVYWIFYLGDSAEGFAYMISADPHKDTQ